ncbi:hypothetical protein PSHT_08266 [Puccinia striiformis]|uniref:Uncharacterized protein n=1 Tax=Puccinia striiformis TaxID=27350 RepID=A0A2S4VQW5_9BASI|nr:hypothetical protein PSHT_08266 [Puccinia striiformis]
MLSCQRISQQLIRFPMLSTLRKKNKLQNVLACVSPTLIKYHIIEINNGRKITSGQQDPIERGEKIEKRQKIEQDQQE